MFATHQVVLRYAISLKCLFFLHTDLIGNRRDFDSVMKTSYKKQRTHLFADQKASLEAMFCKNQFPSGDELAAKASQLNIDLSRVQVGILVFFYVIIII